MLKINNIKSTTCQNAKAITLQPISVSIVFIMLIFIASAALYHTSNIALAEQNHIKITHGIASGDVTNHSAVIWSKSNTHSIMHVKYDTNPNFTNPVISNNSSLVTNNTDYTGKIKLDNLKPNTQYYYQVWFSSPDNKSNNNTSDISTKGTFRTAPDSAHQKDIISFVVGGDLGGQKYCERWNLGYPIFTVIRDLSPDFFIFNGDQIYADGNCSASGPDNVTGWHNIPGNYSAVTDKNVNWANTSQVRDIYNKHWEYNRADKPFEGLLSNTSLYSQADDHEVANNYGNWSYWDTATKNRTGFKSLVDAGIHTFFDFSPIDKNKTNPLQIYRHFNWGKDMDLFILDAHSFRDRNDLPQNSTNVNKTLFGKEQLRWLEQGLLKSNATWKIVSDDNPIFIPGCQNDGIHAPFGCDNWATDGNTTMNFVNERNQFLKFLDDNNIKNVVFITTDVHYPANIVLNQDFNKDGHKLVLYELVSGPLTAGPTEKPTPLDPTVNTTYLYKEGKLFNFGYYKVQKDPKDGKVHFISEIRGIDGLTRPGSYLDLIPK